MREVGNRIGASTEIKAADKKMRITKMAIHGENASCYNGRDSEPGEVLVLDIEWRIDGDVCAEAGAF
jgi:hypothetical protein